VRQARGDHIVWQLQPHRWIARQFLGQEVTAPSHEAICLVMASHHLLRNARAAEGGGQ
jgi:hypothetical protein